MIMLLTVSYQFLLSTEKVKHGILIFLRQLIHNNHPNRDSKASHIINAGLYGCQMCAASIAPISSGVNAGTETEPNVAILVNPLTL